jgi:hypothetical protein
MPDCRPCADEGIYVDYGAGWPELCEFLGKPIPNVPYPHKFRLRAGK